MLLPLDQRGLVHEFATSGADINGAWFGTGDEVEIDVKNATPLSGCDLKSRLVHATKKVCFWTTLTLMGVIRDTGTKQQSALRLLTLLVK
jgi:hypothetical protein